MAALAAGEALGRRIRGGDTETREADRILEVEVITGADLILVALHDRIRILERHVGERLVLALVHNELVRIDGGGRGDLPRFDNRIFLGELGTHEFDRAHVLQRLRIDDRGNETFAGIGEDYQPAIRHGDGAEESDLRVRHRLDVAGRDFVAKDVRDAGVIAAAVKVAAVAREHEALGNRLPEAKFGQRFDVAFENLVELPHAQILLGADLAHRRRQQAAVGRNVEIVGDRFIGKCMDGLPVAVRIGNAHERRQPIRMSHSHQRSIDGIENNLADTRILQQHPRVTGPDVHRHQITERKVAVGEKRGACFCIVGERGDA